MLVYRAVVRELCVSVDVLGLLGYGELYARWGSWWFYHVGAFAITRRVETERFGALPLSILTI